MPIRIGFATAPIFVTVVWHAAFKTNEVAGRGLFAVVATEQGRPVKGLCPFALTIFPLTQEGPVNAFGGGVFKVAQLASLGIDFHLQEFAFTPTTTPVEDGQVANRRKTRGEARELELGQGASSLLYSLARSLSLLLGCW
jgi:hypothetical protein